MKKYAVLMLLVGFGCGAKDNPAVGVDAPPSIDAAPPAFVGRWRQIPPSSLVPEAERAILTIGADHTYVTVDPNTTTNATWQLTADNQLVIASPGSTSTAPYYLGNGNLMVEAGFPVGQVNGVVGTWKGDVISDGLHFILTMVLNPDMTVAYSVAAPNGTGHFEGTWQLDGTTVRLTGTLNGNPAILYAKVIPDVALGSYLYERLP